MLFLSLKTEVGRVNTEALMAKVMNFHPIGNKSEVSFISQSMNGDNLLTIPAVTVTVRDGTFPQYTRCSYINSV